MSYNRANIVASFPRYLLPFVIILLRCSTFSARELVWAHSEQWSSRKNGLLFVVCRECGSVLVGVSRECEYVQTHHERNNIVHIFARFYRLFAVKLH